MSEGQFISLPVPTNGFKIIPWTPEECARFLSRVAQIYIEEHKPSRPALRLIKDRA